MKNYEHCSKEMRTVKMERGNLSELNGQGGALYKTVKIVPYTVPRHQPEVEQQEHVDRGTVSLQALQVSTHVVNFKSRKKASAAGLQQMKTGGEQVESGRVSSGQTTCEPIKFNGKPLMGFKKVINDMIDT